MLIEAGADVNAIINDDKNGYTPMHFAILNIYTPSLEMVKFLFEHGANINTDLLGNFNYSPLDLAVMMDKGNCKIITDRNKRYQLSVREATKLKFLSISLLKTLENY